MYRIIALFLLMSSSYGKQCFTVGKDQFLFKKVKNHKYLINHTSRKIGNYYFCGLYKKALNCSGDDDSGAFKILDKKIHFESPLSFGSPDGPNYKLKVKGKSYKLRDCRP